jgi:hypothetical protein
MRGAKPKATQRRKDAKKRHGGSLALVRSVRRSAANSAFVCASLTNWAQSAGSAIGQGTTGKRDHPGFGLRVWKPPGSGFGQGRLSLVDISIVFCNE